MILCAPTEPPVLRALGIVSSLPEEQGADYLVGGATGLVSIQRKTVSDLLASLADGRLGREVDLLRGVDKPVLLVEGRPMWTPDGYLIDRNRFPRKAWHGLLLSVLWAGVGVVGTDSLDHTAALLRDAEAWVDRSEHTGLMVRPATRDSFGQPVPWGVLLGVQGVGPKLAAAIYQEFKRVPLRWDVGVKDLERVPGVGKVKAARLWGAFG